MLLDESAFTTVSRFRLLDGRLPGLDRADEVLVNPEIMAVTGWHVGDRVTDMKLYRMSDMEDQEPIPSKGTAVSFTIVGEARRVDEYVDEPDERVPRIYLTPAFGQTYPDSWFYLNELVVLAGGSAALPAFRDAVAHLAAAAHAQVLVSSIGDGEAFAQSALRPQVIALWLFAAVVLAGLVLVAGQAIGRQINAQQRDLPDLRALGTVRGERWLLGGLHGATVAVVAAVVAVVVAFVSSVVTPLGAAHDVEPSPGLSADAAVLAFGALAGYCCSSPPHWCQRGVWRAEPRRRRVAGPHRWLVSIDRRASPVRWRASVVARRSSSGRAWLCNQAGALQRRPCERSWSALPWPPHC
jgi:hypothetical protein